MVPIRESCGDPSNLSVIVASCMAFTKCPDPHGEVFCQVTVPSLGTFISFFFFLWLFHLGASDEGDMFCFFLLEMVGGEHKKKRE